jgi:phage protein D
MKKRNGFSTIGMVVSAMRETEEKQAKRRIANDLQILGSTGEPKGPAKIVAGESVAQIRRRRRAFAAAKAQVEAEKIAAEQSNNSTPAV